MKTTEAGRFVPQSALKEVDPYGEQPEEARLKAFDLYQEIEQEAAEREEAFFRKAAKEAESRRQFNRVSETAREQIVDTLMDVGIPIPDSAQEIPVEESHMGDIEYPQEDGRLRGLHYRSWRIGENQRLMSHKRSTENGKIERWSSATLEPDGIIGTSISLKMDTEADYDPDDIVDHHLTGMTLQSYRRGGNENKGSVTAKVSFGATDGLPLYAEISRVGGKFEQFRLLEIRRDGDSLKTVRVPNVDACNAIDDYFEEAEGWRPGILAMYENGGVDIEQTFLASMDAAEENNYEHPVLIYKDSQEQ